MEKNKDVKTMCLPENLDDHVTNTISSYSYLLLTTIETQFWILLFNILEVHSVVGVSVSVRSEFSHKNRKSMKRIYTCIK